MNLLFDILYVGILWVVGCIPLVTAGASTTAAYYAMAKCVRHKTGYIGREYWSSFKSNFRQILPVTILVLLFFAGCSMAVYLMPWAILVIPGVYLYALSFPMEKMLKRLMPPVSEDSEEAQKWYYQ